MSKSLSTFCAASLENVSSVSGLHSLSEAVLFLSLTLFGLVSSKHFIYLLEDWIRKRFYRSNCSDRRGKQAKFTLLHNDIVYYTRYGTCLSRTFLNFLSFFENSFLFYNKRALFTVFFHFCYCGILDMVVL